MNLNCPACDGPLIIFPTARLAGCHKACSGSTIWHPRQFGCRDTAELEHKIRLEKKHINQIQPGNKNHAGNSKKGARMRRMDLSGRQFGLLTVVRKAQKTEHDLPGRATVYLVKCECGKQKFVRGSDMTHRRNPTRSCGCRNGKKIEDV